MKPALSFRQPHYPSSWQELPNGEAIVTEINQMLKPWWPKFFGYYLVTIGALSRNICSDNSVIHHKINIASKDVSHLDSAVRDTKSSGKHHFIQSDIDDLPLIKRSVDVCILSHALEFSLDPHHVVREANRVLIPNGYLVITGYNPFSLAGLNKWLPYRKEQTPWNERFFSSMRIKDWLHLMGYEILMDEQCLHSTLVGKMKHGKIISALKAFAQNYLQSLGSIYVIVAKKRELPLTPIKPKWQIRTEFKPGKVAPVTSAQPKHSKYKANK